MFYIDEDQTIHITRGDAATFTVGATIGGEDYIYQQGDVVRIKAFAKKNCANVVLSKDFNAEEGASTVEIKLTGKETKFGGIISKPTDYWYEVELNPDTHPQTIIGYDENGAKIMKLYPEGEEEV